MCKVSSSHLKGFRPHEWVKYNGHVLFLYCFFLRTGKIILSREQNAKEDRKDSNRKA